MEKYLIGDIGFCWDGLDYQLDKGTYFDKFRISDSADTDEIHFSIVYESLKQYTEYPLISSNYAYELYQVNAEKLLIYHWRCCRLAFGVWIDRIDSEKQNFCSFDPAIKNELPMNEDWFFGLSGFTKALFQKKAVVLHASYIDYKGTAILFSAPSQTGKSTQARLWSEYAGAEIINGDRALLKEKKGSWHAYGYPCCGSSDICINRTLPIRAIIILEQGSENKLVSLSASEKIRSIVTGMELYRWDLKELEEAFKLAESIAAGVEMLKLVSRPDADSVALLKEFLEEK